MRYDRNNLRNLMKKDLRNYPCPRCHTESFMLQDLTYLIGGPVTVDVRCPGCYNRQQIKFHIDVV